MHNSANAIKRKLYASIGVTVAYLDIINQIKNMWCSTAPDEYHSADCWKHHAACAIAILVREIEFLEYDYQTLDQLYNTGISNE